MMRTEWALAALALGLANAAPAAAADPSPGAAGSAERSLEAITIAGVAKGPEVLFINAREPARVELRLGWQLLAAAGLLEPTLPAPPTLRPAAADPLPPLLETDSILNL